MIPKTKICGRCGVEKTASEFPLRKKGGGKYVWLRLQCYECMRDIRNIAYKEKDRDKIIARNKIYADKNKDRVAQWNKEYNQKNAEIIKENRRIRYLQNSEEVKQKRKVYYYNNRQKIIDANSEYIKKNLPIIRANQRKNHEKKKHINVEYVLKRKLRARILMAVKNKGKKCATTMELIGCSIDFIRNYLEKKFTDGMSWDNQGKWHIDHIKACAKFDLTNSEEQRKCFHYTNLQPLWGIDNVNYPPTQSDGMGFKSE